MKQSTLKPKFGNIYAVPLEEETEAWLLYTHDNDEGDNIVRVLKGVHRTGSFDAAFVTQANVQFDVHYNSISYGLKKQHLRWIGHVELTGDLKEMPLFRERTSDLRTKEPIWWIYDKEQRIRVDASDPRLPHLSRPGLVNHPALLEKIRFGWTPEIAFANGWA